MKILIIGNSYFSKKIGDSLSRYDPNNRYVVANTYEKKWDKIKYVLHLLNTDIVYSIGGGIVDSKAFDLALALNKKVIMHWIGSDVLKALKNFNNQKINERYIHEIRHFSEVSWINEELSQMGITADIVQFATMSGIVGHEATLPQKFSILSYVGKGNESFYGIEQLLKLADDFPSVEIKIAGITEYNNAPIPPNVKLLGWVDNMSEQYQDCVLYLRLTQHDGLAFSVLEALANGRYVGYSHNFNQTVYIPSYPMLKEMVNGVHLKFKQGILAINQEGRDFIKKEYEEKVIVNDLIQKFKKIKEAL